MNPLLHADYACQIIREETTLAELPLEKTIEELCVVGDRDAARTNIIFRLGIRFGEEFEAFHDLEAIASMTIAQLRAVLGEVLTVHKADAA